MVANETGVKAGRRVAAVGDAVEVAVADGAGVDAGVPGRWVGRKPVRYTIAVNVGQVLVEAVAVVVGCLGAGVQAGIHPIVVKVTAADSVGQQVVSARGGGVGTNRHARVAGAVIAVLVVLIDVVGAVGVLVAAPVVNVVGAAVGGAAVLTVGGVI